MVKSGTRVIFFFLLAALAACAPMSQDIRRQADESAPFSEIQKNPDKFSGTVVIWGGVIIETTNLKESTAIKVMQTALDIQQRPTDLDRSEGRFIIRVDRFLDPDIFKKGRQITVGGRDRRQRDPAHRRDPVHLSCRPGKRIEAVGAAGPIPAVLLRPVVLGPALSLASLGSGRTGGEEGRRPSGLTG